MTVVFATNVLLFRIDDEDEEDWATAADFLATPENAKQVDVIGLTAVAIRAQVEVADDEETTTAFDDAVEERKKRPNIL